MSAATLKPPAERKPTRREAAFWTQRSLAGMEARGEIYPGSAARILPMVKGYEPSHGLAHLAELFLDRDAPPTPRELAASQSAAKAAGAIGVGNGTPAFRRPEHYGQARKYLNVEHAPGKVESPLRSVLMRFGLTAHHVAALHDRYAAELAGKPAESLPAAVVELLRSEEHEHRQPAAWEPDPLNENQRDIKGVLDDLRLTGQVTLTAAQAVRLATKWGEEGGAFASVKGIAAIAQGVYARVAADREFWSGDEAPKFVPEPHQHYNALERQRAVDARARFEKDHPEAVDAIRSMI